MTPLFKFSLLGLGAASAGGGVICISKREAIREYFRGPSNQTPAGSGEGSRASGVQESSLNTTTESSTTDTQGTDLNNRRQDSNQGETRSPVPGEHQVDGSKDPIVTEDQKVNGASETAESPQDLQQPDAPRDQAQDRGNLPTDQNQIQQLPPGGPGSIDPVPNKPQEQDGESVQGSKVVGGDAVDGPQKLDGEAEPKVNPQGQDSNPAGGSQRAGEGVNPGPGPGEASGPGHDGGADPNPTHQGSEPGLAPREGDQTDPNATPQGGVPSPDGTGQPRVEGPDEKVQTQDGDLNGQEKVPGGGLDEHSSSNNPKGGPGAGGGGGSLPEGAGAPREQGSGDPGSRAPVPGSGALPGSGGDGAAPTEPSPEGHTPAPSHPAPAKDTTDYQCLFGGGKL